MAVSIILLSGIIGGFVGLTSYRALLMLIAYDWWKSLPGEGQNFDVFTRESMGFWGGIVGSVIGILSASLPIDNGFGLTWGLAGTLAAVPLTLLFPFLGIFATAITARCFALSKHWSDQCEAHVCAWRKSSELLSGNEGKILAEFERLIRKRWLTKGNKRRLLQLAEEIIAR